MQPNPYQSPSSVTPHYSAASAKLTISQILFSFSGRIPRRTYWGASILSGLAFILPIVVVGILTGALADGNGASEAASSASPMSSIGLALMAILYLVMGYVSLAIGTKRWHDRDKSGWMILVSIIPIIGAIYCFIQCGCLRGTAGPNRFGQDPT